MKVKIALLGGVAALTAMAAITTHATEQPGPAFTATGTATTTSPLPVPKAKATAFVGGDWPGMGSFGEDWAK